jgi:hypothetical protein
VFSAYAHRAPSPRPRQAGYGRLFLKAQLLEQLRLLVIGPSRRTFDGGGGPGGEATWNTADDGTGSHKQRGYIDDLGFAWHFAEDL